MVLRILTALFLLGVGATAQAQTDTLPAPPTRLSPSCRLVGRPVSRVGCDSAGGDTTLPDIESMIDSIEVLRNSYSWPRDPMGAEVRRRLRDSLAAQRQRWAWRRPRTYIVRTLDISDAICIITRPRVNGRPPRVRDRLIVRDTAVVGRDPAPIAEADLQRCVLNWRVEDLFADVAQVIADTTLHIGRVEYDLTYGFPRRYSYIRSYPFDGPCQGRACGVRVETFAPAP